MAKPTPFRPRDFYYLQERDSLLIAADGQVCLAALPIGAAELVDLKVVLTTKDDQTRGSF